jgi:Uma2 family endonuclease
MQPHTKVYTPEEYLALEEKVPVKSEFFQGRIYQMTGASLNHNRIVANLSGLFYRALNGQSCEHFIGDMRLLVKANGLYTYPDLMVVCGPVDLAAGQMDTLTNPLLIIEVLSESTAEYDRTDKFELYKGLDSLQNYALVDQRRPYIQVFKRLENEPRLWVLESFTGLESQATFPALELSLSLADIYNRVELLATDTFHPHQPE